MLERVKYRKLLTGSVYIIHIIISTDVGTLKFKLRIYLFTVFIYFKCAHKFNEYFVKIISHCHLSVFTQEYEEKN